MGNESSKYRTSATTSVDTRPFFNKVKDNKIQIEVMRMLADNIQEVLDKMKREVKENELFPNAIFDPLFESLESLKEVLQPEQPNICYIVGSTNTGKSTTINAICGSPVCDVSDTDIPGTEIFQVVKAPEVNTTFIDTVGFGAQATGDRKLLKTMQQFSKQGHQPDAIILIVTKDSLRKEEHLVSTIKGLNKYLIWLKNRRFKSEVPVLCVLGKIDEYFKGQLPLTPAHDETVKAHTKRVLERVNATLVYPATCCIPISAEHDYGIETLRNSINAHSPFNAQIIDRNLDYFTRARKSIGNKIIAAFSTAAAAVSLLPFVDVVMLTVLQDWMYCMLACFSIDSRRTPETFKTLNHSVQSAGLGIRTTAFVVGRVAKLSVIGYAVGSAICVASASSSIAVLGWACYHYFIEEVRPSS
jgi:GTPase Era involved in 16S rRNA processing/uncharacterized protein (DUF697 family)